MAETAIMLALIFNIGLLGAMIAIIVVKGDK